MNVHRNVLVAAAIAGSLLTAGCPSEEKPKTETAAPQPVATATPAPTATPTPAPTAAETAAVAQDSAPLPAPPADQAETPGAAPSPHHTWVHGYWHWVAKKYEWHAGYWEDQNGFGTAAPPALQMEHPGIAPGAGYSWLPGYWHWSGKAYAWAPGHWSVARAGFAYTHPTYVEEKGHWIRQGYGWEKEDPAWKKKYAPPAWEKKGEVWVHKTEAAEFVKRGEREGWNKPAPAPHH